MRYLLPLAVGAVLTVGLASPAQAASNGWTADVSGHAISWGGSLRIASGKHIAKAYVAGVSGATNC